MQLTVLKIGGHTLDNEKESARFLADFASLTMPRILIHGGGKIATKIGEQLGIESKYVNGRRITDEAAIDLVTMVYAGLINKKLTAQLQKHNCNAIGLTGADGNILKATKRPVKEIDYGFAGDIEAADVNVEFLSLLLRQNMVPVLAPLTHANGEMLNTNADTIASATAIAMSTHFDIKLILCSEKKGILRSLDDDNSLIAHLDEAAYIKLKDEGIFTGGMLPKLENTFAALYAGVKEVWIGDAENLLAHFRGKPGGTLIALKEIKH